MSTTVQFFVDKKPITPVKKLKDLEIGQLFFFRVDFDRDNLHMLCQVYESEVWMEGGEATVYRQYDDCELLRASSSQEVVTPDIEITYKVTL